MVQFKVIAFTPDDFERLIYIASERQVHQTDSNLKDYPPDTRFLLVREEK